MKWTDGAPSMRESYRDAPVWCRCRINAFLDSVDVGEHFVHGDLEAYSCEFRSVCSGAIVPWTAPVSDTSSGLVGAPDHGGHVGPCRSHLWLQHHSLRGSKGHNASAVAPVRRWRKCESRAFARTQASSLDWTRSCPAVWRRMYRKRHPRSSWASPQWDPCPSHRGEYCN